MTVLSALSMRKKLLLAPALAAVLMVVSAVAGYIGIKSQHASLQSIYQERIPAMRTAAVADRNLAGVQASTYKLLAMMDANFPADKVDAATKTIRADLDTLQTDLQTAAHAPGREARETAKFEDAAKGVAQYQKIINDVIDVAGVQVSMATAFMSKAQAKYDELAVQLKDLRDLEDEDAESAYRGAEAGAGRATAGVLVALLLSVVLSTALALYVASKIVQSINAIRKLTGKLSEGDLGQGMATPGPKEAGGAGLDGSSVAQYGIDMDRKDEIGDLARSVSTLVQYLKEMAAVSEAIAGGDLSGKVEPRSERDTLGHAFARMTDGLRVLVRSVRDNAAEVTGASSQVAAASEDSARVSGQASAAIDEVTATMQEMNVVLQSVVRNTQVQTSSIGDTSAAIDQMIASIQHVADTSKQLLDIAERSRQEAQTGIVSMGKATDGLNRINTSIRSAAEIIDSLGNRTSDIGKIIGVIDDLAEQTNLLALNAAIEAARAGEHGLGFAVVADEVRKLAEKSAQSTKEVSELIRSIQTEAQQAVDKMEKSTIIVDQGLTLGADLNSALAKISSVVTEVNRFVQEIGAATREQAHGSEQIARATTRLNEIAHEINSSIEEQASGTQAVMKAMDSMREMVQRSTSSSTELAASAEQMSRMSQRLLEVMQRFKLEAQGASEREQRRPAFASAAHRS
ncbi:MAG: MCP four helix bundle domain-containing protein [Acidobacteriia bacterium]|nr:MCP four helix bundle domain-containing protein [Terriglobia bacterium]